MIIELALAGGVYVASKIYAKLKEQLAPPSSPHAEGDAAGRTLTPTDGTLARPGTRQEQLQVMSRTSNAAEAGEAEKKLNRYLALAATALGLATAGALLYPPLSLLSLLPALYVTGPVWRGAYHALAKEHRIRVSVLDTVVFVLAVGTGNYVALALGGCLYYVSRVLLLKTEDSSRAHLIQVFSNQPRFVWLHTDGVDVEVPLEDVRRGDILVVRAGETVPADGTIAAGVASIDQRLLTGEAQPAEKGVGDPVFASTTLLAGSVHVQVERAGTETVVAQIGAILDRTADFKTAMQSRGEALADKMATPFLALGAVALPTLGAVGAGSVLTASFGYHMRILAPVGMLNFLTLMSRHGILVKDGRSLESLREVDTVVFDKTGTLTLEQPHVGHIYTCRGHDENEVLRYAAAAEWRQTHPVARAILHAAATREMFTLPSDDAHYDVGYGIKVRVDHRLVRAGSASFMAMEGIAIPDTVRRLQVESDLEGHALVYVAIDDELAGVIELLATLRPEAKRVVEELKERNLSVVIISGDHELPTRRLARALEIDRYYAATLPEDKARLIEQLHAEGRVVCFVGDGINDAIALKQARASISLRGASTAATDTAQIVLMDQSLNELCHAFDIAKDFDANMRVSSAMTIIPGIVGLAGAFFLHFGMVAPIVLNNIGLVIGLGNAMRPVWKQRRLPSAPVVHGEARDDDLASAAHGAAGRERSGSTPASAADPMRR